MLKGRHSLLCYLIVCGKGTCFHSLVSFKPFPRHHGVAMVSRSPSPLRPAVRPLRAAAGTVGGIGDVDTGGRRLVRGPMAPGNHGLGTGQQRRQGVERVAAPNSGDATEVQEGSGTGTDCGTGTSASGNLS